MQSTERRELTAELPDRRVGRIRWTQISGGKKTASPLTDNGTALEPDRGRAGREGGREGGREEGRGGRVEGAV